MVVFKVTVKAFMNKICQKVNSNESVSVDIFYSDLMFVYCCTIMSVVYIIMLGESPIEAQVPVNNSIEHLFL